MIRLALVNAQRITSILSLQVRSVAYLDEYLVSLDRIVEYGELPIEDGQLPSMHIPSAWPEHGAITFRSFSA
jgi:hypothetical protein